MTIFERIEELRKTIGISQGKLEKELGFSNGSISKWKNSTPKSDRLQKLADYFGVSVEYLMTGNDDEAKEQPQLSARDERDISRRLEQTLSDLENQQDALMFDGAPLDEETKELFKRRAWSIAYVLPKLMRRNLQTSVILTLRIRRSDFIGYT